MLLEEFEARTHFYPTDDLYRVIEEEYTNFAGDKDEFCKAYLKNKDGIAEKIQRQALQNSIRDAEEKLHEMQELQKKIAELEMEKEAVQKRLEREQEWKAYEISHMSQDRYADLRKSCGTEVFSQSRAAVWIEHEFGFSYSKIRVFVSIPEYEINRHRQIRKIGLVSREPAYNATDWNYVRFDVCGLQYEVVNGELYQYCD